MTSTKTPPYSGSRAKRQAIPLFSAKLQNCYSTSEHQGSSQAWRYSIEFWWFHRVQVPRMARELRPFCNCSPAQRIAYGILRQLHIISGICCSYKHKSGRHSSSQLIKQLIILSCMVIIYCRKIYSKIVEEFMKRGNLVAAFICL